jgi:hypothetical protein
MRDENDSHQNPRLVLQMSSPACERLEVAGQAKSLNSDVSIQATRINLIDSNTIDITSLILEVVLKGRADSGVHTYFRWIIT